MKEFRRAALSLAAVVFTVLFIAAAGGVSTYAATATDDGTSTETLEFTSVKKKIKAGKTFKFKVNLKGVTWSVSNTKKAKINQKGKLTAKRYGKVTVTATLGDQSVSIKVTIKPKAVIGIDAGHQAHANYGLEAIGPGSSVKKIKVSGGTSGVYTGKPEYKLTLEVAKKLRKELIKRGYKVVMTRTTHNVNISNKQRALKLNKKCDISIRLHADGSTSSSVKGASVLYPSMSNPYLSNKICKKSRKLAQEILSSYCSATSISSRGLYTRDDLTGTNWSKIPVVLLEMGFMTNSSDDKYMSSKKGQKAIVKGIANGIDAYF